MATIRRHIEGIAVGTLPIYLHTLISELLGTLQNLLCGQRSSAIPDASISNAVETDSDISRRYCRPQGIHAAERAGCNCRLDELAPIDLLAFPGHLNFLRENAFEKPGLADYLPDY
jgi:hypothetical protein